MIDFISLLQDLSSNHRNIVIFDSRNDIMASGGILTTELRQQFVSADDYMLQSHLKNADWLSHGQRLERAFWLVIFINRIEYISSVLPHVSVSLHDLDRASMKNTTSITSITRFTEKPKLVLREETQLSLYLKKSGEGSKVYIAVKLFLNLFALI